MIKKRTLFTLILLIALLGIMYFNLQNFMLYYPGSYTPSPHVLSANQIRFWPAEGIGYRGFGAIVPAAPHRGTILIFHGNAGTASDRIYYVRALAPLGFRVILAEYPGYGSRKGKPGEKSFVEDGRQTVKLVFEQYGGPIYLAGESLGSAVAASLLKESPVPIDGIMLITPWESLFAVAKEKFPWLPVRLLLRDTYDTAAKLKQYEGRIAVIGAERDEIIPPHHAHALYAAVAGKKRMWMIRGAGHNDWPEIINYAAWIEIADFITGEGP